MRSDWQNDVEFTTFKELYPRREGGENWKQVYKAWNRALKVSDVRVVTDGAMRYRKYCEAKDLINTHYVQMATTFLNQENWLKPWDGPVKYPKSTSEEKPLPPSASELLRRRQNDPRGSK